VRTKGPVHKRLTLLEVNFTEERVPLRLDPFGGTMFLLMCMLVIAVFHLDEFLFAPRGFVYRRKMLCDPCLNGELTDPDGRPALI